MRHERWTSPPVVAREATPEWVGVWRFRAVAILLAAFFVWALYLVFQIVSGANDQDPGIGALAPLALLLS